MPQPPAPRSADPSGPTPRARARRPNLAERRAYLEALKHGATHTDAAAAAGRSFESFRALRRHDARFAARVAEAWSSGADVLEREAFRRAVEGVEDVKSIGSGAGAEVVTFRRYSDRLLELLLRGRRPELYADSRQRVEVTGAGGGPIRQTHEVDAAATLEVLAEVGLIAPALADELEPGPAGRVTSSPPAELEAASPLLEPRHREP